MPYINVDEAYILDNTGLQVDQSVDYANANSNRNLLDNPFFTVNQKNTSGTYSTTSSTFMDRWILSAGSVSVSTSGVTLSSGGAIRQYIEKDRLIDGGTFTLSVKTQDGNTYSASGTIDFGGAGGNWQISATLIPNALWVGVRLVTGSRWDVALTSTNGVAISAVKLELGSYSTLINDTPPDYGEELRKCQYYYREIKCTTTGYAMIGFATATTAFQACLPYVMRVRPSITYSGTLTAYYAGGNSAVTTVAANAEFTNSIQVAFTTTGLTAGSIVALAMGSGAKLMFSADL